MITVASCCGPMRCDLGVVESFGHGSFDAIDHRLCVALLKRGREDLGQRRVLEN